VSLEATSLYGSLRSSAASPPSARSNSPLDVRSRSSCLTVVVEQVPPPLSIPTDAFDDFVYITKDDFSADDAVVHPTAHKFRMSPLFN
jgi:hypothetical protein